MIAAASEDANATWDAPTPAPEEDWQGTKPFTLKDMDWGKMTALAQDGSLPSKLAIWCIASMR
jgi:hypothetical protein